MKYYLKLFTSILLAFIIVVGLSACGKPLEKPTGLEKSVDEQTEQDDAGEVLKQAGAEAKTKDESKKAEQDDAELSKADAEKDEQVKEDSSEKAVDSKEENKESSAVEIKKEEKVSKTNSEGVKKPNASSATEPATPAPSKSGSVSKTPDRTKQSAETAPKPTEQPKGKPVEKSKADPKPEPVKNTIVHSIVISSNEMPLAPTEMEIEDGDTVLEALIEITMANKIHMDYRGGQGATAYIQGMGNVYEFDRGQGSGWMYRVNGIFPDRGAGVVPLLGGDIVEWLYTTDLGVDLGANLQPFRR